MSASDRSFFFQAEDGIRDGHVTGVQTCALPICVEPMGGDVNNLLPQMVGSYLPVILVALAFLMIIGSLSSTADSEIGRASCRERGEMSEGAGALREKDRDGARKARHKCGYSV